MTARASAGAWEGVAPRTVTGPSGSAPVGPWIEPVPSARRPVILKRASPGRDPVAVFGEEEEALPVSRHRVLLLREEERRRDVARRRRRRDGPAGEKLAAHRPTPGKGSKPSRPTWALEGSSGSTSPGRRGMWGLIFLCRLGSSNDPLHQAARGDAETNRPAPRETPRRGPEVPLRRPRAGSQDRAGTGRNVKKARPTLSFSSPPPSLAVTFLVDF